MTFRKEPATCIPLHADEFISSSCHTLRVFWWKMSTLKKIKIFICRLQNALRKTTFSNLLKTLCLFWHYADLPTVFPFVIACSTGLFICSNNPSWKAKLLMSSDLLQNPTGEPQQPFLAGAGLFLVHPVAHQPHPSSSLLAAGWHCWRFMKVFLGAAVCNSGCTSCFPILLLIYQELCLAASVTADIHCCS